MRENQRKPEPVVPQNMAALDKPNRTAQTKAQAVYAGENSLVDRTKQAKTALF